MDNQHLRAIILKLQDRLSDDDRRRLHFFLGNDVPRRVRDDPSLSGTLCLMESLFDQDKISEDDFTFLINAFTEIRCVDAVKLLREHMKRMQSHTTNQPMQSLSTIMPHMIDQAVEDEVEDRVSIPTVFVDEKKDSVSYNTTVVQKNGYDNRIAMTDSDMLEISPKPATNRSPTPIPLLQQQEESLEKSSIAKKCSLILAVLVALLTMTLIGLIVGFILIKSELKEKNLNYSQEQEKNNEIIQSLRDLHMKVNATAHELTKKAKSLEDQLQIIIGTTCRCQTWCREHNSTSHGACGDGDTCICRNEPITKTNVGNGCTCNAWCRKHGHPTGGICGDRRSCICSK